MQINSSYIFLPKKDNRSKPKQNLNSVIQIELGKSVQSILKQNFNINSNDISHNEFFKKEIKTMVRVDDFDFEVSFSINTVVDNTYVDVIISHRSKAQSIKCMEHINSILNGSSFEEHFIIIVSYDAISEYYCNKIYPRLNEIERTLRKLLFNIYIVNFGRAYYTKTIKPELQSKIKGIVQAKGNNEKKEIERLKMFFYSLEYVDIQTMLFESRWTSLEEQQKNDFLSEHSNLAELSDEQLRKAFESLSPKSDWERFFDDKVFDIDVKSLIDNIRLSRNNIAHCKFFYNREYQACTRAITKLKKAIDKAIILTEEIDFKEKNMEKFKSVFAGFPDMFSQYQENFSRALELMAQRTAEITRVLQPHLASLSEFTISFQRMIQSVGSSAISKISLLSDNLHPHVENKENSSNDAKEISPEERNHDSS